MNLGKCRCQCETSPVECLKDAINIACHANSVDRDIHGRVKFLSGCLEDLYGNEPLVVLWELPYSIRTSSLISCPQQCLLFYNQIIQRMKDHPSTNMPIYITQKAAILVQGWGVDSLLIFFFCKPWASSERWEYSILKTCTHWHGYNRSNYCTSKQTNKQILQIFCVQFFLTVISRTFYLIHLIWYFPHKSAEERQKFFTFLFQMHQLKPFP